MRNRPTAGFTLIEMLLTLSMFGLLMSVLLSGLTAGTRAWRRADASLTRSSELHFAIEEFVWDLENMYAETTSFERPFRITFDTTGGTVVDLWTVETRPDRIRLGTASQIEWRLQASDRPDETFDWVRTAQAYSGTQVRGDFEEEVMLEDVGEVQYFYLVNGEWREDWPGAEAAGSLAIPDIMQVRVRMAGAPATEQWKVIRPAKGLQR